MPQNTYVITEPETGRKVKLTGPAPPTAGELEQIFKSLPAVTPTVPRETPPLADAAPGLMSQLGTVAATVAGDVGDMITSAAKMGGRALHAGTMGGVSGAATSLAKDLLIDPAKAQFAKAVDAFKQGRYSEGAGYATAGVIPMAGPMAAQIGELIPQTEQGTPEQRAQAAGHILTLVGSVAAPEIVKSLPASIKARIPLIGRRNPNPVEAEAVDYGLSQGIPVDAGTATGNPAIKGTQYLADRTLAGSAVSVPAKAAEAEALTRVGRQLTERTNAGPAQTPVTAGEGIKGAVASKVADLHREANTAYDALRQLEPANMQAVQVGTAPSKSGVIKAVPVTEDMAFPVKLTDAKAALRPIYDRMKRQMPLTQQQASPGLKAIENIVNGPDVAPASIVDLDLSAIKSIARQADSEFTRNLGQGMAANAVKQLDAAVMEAVKRGGPEAEFALKTGRQATRSKYLAADVLDKLNAEPQRAFTQATAPRDASIAQLRELQRIAPDQMPELGRAFMEDLMDTATKEGGFGKSATVATKWQNLGPQTKQLLFGKTPGLVTELDKFFTLAKRLGENPNPSGSGGVASIGGQLAAFLEPTVGTGIQLSGYTLAKALRNPKVVRMLTEGLTISPRNIAYRTALTARIGAAMKAAEDEK